MKAQDTQSASRKGLSRKLRLGTVATITTVIVIAVVMLLNIGMDVLEKRFPIAVDLTADGTFTMSDNSIQLAQMIGQNERIGNTEIIVFVNEALFTNNEYDSYPMMYELKETAIQNAGSSDGTAMYNRLIGSFETVLDQFYYMLKQYQVESNGKISHRFIDVDANPALASAYQEYEIGAGTVLFLNEDGTRSQKFELLNMISLDQQSSAVLPEYNSEAERLVAACLNLVTAEDSKKATFLLGHGEDNTLINTLQQILINNACDVVALDITASNKPEEDTDIFVIAAPTKDYTDEEIAMLREWLDNDGKRGRDLVVIADHSAKLPSLYEMVGDEYGIVVTDTLVCETDSANIAGNNTLYPYGAINSTEYTSALIGQRVLMPMTRAIEVTVTTETDAALYGMPIVSFGDSAKVQTLADLEAGKVQIEDYKTPESTPHGAAYTTAKQYDNDTKQYYTTNVMVFGSSMALYQSTMSIPSAAANETVFTETFRGLTGLDSVISVSSRSLREDTLDFGDSATPNTYAVIFMGVLPLGFVIAGVVVFVIRRRL